MSLREKIRDEIKIAEALKRVEEKDFRFPFGKKVGRGQKRKNFVTVLILNENGTYIFNKYRIEDQTIMHEMIPRLATTGHVMFDKKGNPMVILPNWSVEPFSPLEHYKQSMIDGSNTKGYQILLAKLLSEQIKPKKPMGNLIKWIIGIGLIGIIAYAFISGSGS